MGKTKYEQLVLFGHEFKDIIKAMKELPKNRSALRLRIHRSQITKHFYFDEKWD